MLPRSTIAVLGASGVLGNAVTRRFREQGWDVTTVSRGEGSDRRYDPHDEHSVSAAISGSAMVVSVAPTLSPEIVRSTLRTGKVLLTVGALSVTDRAELWRLAPEGMPGTAVLNGGISPGLTNLAAASLLARHPDADGVQVAQMMSSRGTAGTSGLEYAIGRLRTETRHRTVDVPFPDRGSVRAFDVSAGHDAWLERIPGLHRTDLLLVFPERVLSAFITAINALGLCRLLPARLPGRRRVPARMSREPFEEWIAVTKDGTTLAAMTLEASGDYWTTAASAEAQSALLLEKQRAGFLRPGLHSIESVLELGPVASKLGAELVVRAG